MSSPGPEGPWASLGTLPSLEAPVSFLHSQCSGLAAVFNTMVITDFLPTVLSFSGTLSRSLMIDTIPGSRQASGWTGLAIWLRGSGLGQSWKCS